ncbi:uncharacterized protein LOC143912927 [Arctopsyche grandis]|uniref:uncharacterized protein LOC143912927 n=1 Tax=Arctopsyche grandis TaxID=121162 RepID=UPI00406D9336
MDEEEVNTKHLLALTSIIETSDPPSILLKSYLLAHCAEISTYKFKLPNKVFGSNVRCSNCFTSWYANKTFQKINVLKKKLTVSAKKRYKKIKRNKSGKNSQDAIEKVSKILNSDIYRIQCCVCNKFTELFCEKRKIAKKRLSESLNITNTPVNVKKKVASGSSVTSKNSNTPSEMRNKKMYSKDKNLTKLFYQTPDKQLEEKASPKVNNTNAIAKKKRHRDKFAGLCKIACTSSPNTPRKNGPLNLFLKSI